jgi:hypothetical protein
MPPVPMSPRGRRILEAAMLPMRKFKAALLDSALSESLRAASYEDIPVLQKIGHNLSHWLAGPTC